MKPLAVTVNREIERVERGNSESQLKGEKREGMTEAVESQMGASLSLSLALGPLPASFKAVQIEGMETHASMHSGGLSPVAGAMAPLLERLEPCLLSTDKTESGNIAWNTVYHLLSKELLPLCKTGMCGLEASAVRGLGFIDFLYMQYKIGAIGKVWFDQGEIARALAATPWVAINPRTAYPGTLEWIKALGKSGSAKKPTGPVFCDLCLDSRHPGHLCDAPFHLIRVEMPRTDISQWKALYKRWGMELGAPPPSAAPSLLDAVRGGQRKLQAPTTGSAGPRPPLKKQMLKKE